jgi:methionyl-tRNA formyltransferase
VVLKILFCGYRDWAIQTFDVLSFWSSLNGDHLSLATNPEAFNTRTNRTSFDITALVGWSEILPAEYVESNYTVVVHPSDLPEYAGGSPIQHQIIDGLTKTKATLIKASAKLDAGPIIDKEDLSLEGDLRDIFSNLADASFELLKRFLLNYPNHKEIKQNRTTLKKRRTPSMSEIKLEDFKSSTAEQIYNKIRALQDPYPNAFIVCGDGKKLHLTGASHG